MLGWIAVFFLIAIVAVLYGFGGIAVALGVAKMLFFLMVVVMVAGLIVRVLRRGSNSPPPMF